jgi:hypothetical protein
VPIASDCARSTRSPGAGAAEHFSIARTSRRKLIPSPHRFADNTFAFISGKFFRGQIDFHPLRGEKIVVGHFAISQHLLLFLYSSSGCICAPGLWTILWPRCGCLCQCSRRRRWPPFSPVAELQRALAQAAAGDHRDGIGRATIDLHKSDQALAVFAARVVDAKFRRPSMARRTPRTCPAHRCPWACSAS